MVHSTWGEWFVRDEVEATEPAGASCWYLGCNGFVIRSAEATLYIDPYFADGDAPELVRMIPVPMDPADATLADAVLFSHEHIDHVHPPSYGPLVENCDAAVYGTSACWDGRQHYEGDMRLGGNETEIGVGDDFEVGDFTVHVRGANDPDAFGEVSFVVEHDSGTFFHGGDARPGEFEAVGEEFDIDLGALAFGSVGTIHDPETGHGERTVWYMDENQVIECANALGLDRLVPTHHDMWRGMDADPKVLHDHATTFEYPHVVERVRIGDRLDFGEPGIRKANALE
jgi:L-ascorbate 6-phosphate lactonase